MNRPDLHAATSSTLTRRCRSSPPASPAQGRSRESRRPLIVIALVAIVSLAAQLAPHHVRRADAATTGVVQVAVGRAHSAVLKADGTLWMFGYNGAGQLGSPPGPIREWSSPKPRFVMAGVAQVATGQNHTLVLKKDKSLWAFGENYYAESGRVGCCAIHTPSLVMSGVVRMSAGDKISAAIKTDGSLWTFGCNNVGQLGHSANHGAGCSANTPRKVMTGVARVDAGYHHIAVVKTDGTLWTFGANYGGELGHSDGSWTKASPPRQAMTGVADVAAGSWHTVALKSDGTVWTFGVNWKGELGDSRHLGYSGIGNPTPTMIMSGVKAKAVAAGGTTAMVLGTDGTLWAFGSEWYGRLGTSPNAQQTTLPTAIATGVSSMAIWNMHSAIIKSDATVWTFGRNTDGELGRATNFATGVPNPTPGQVILPASPTPPAAPTALVGAPSNGRVQLSWKVPAHHGAPILDYVVQYRANATVAWSTFNDGVRPTPTALVTGLVNARGYVFRVLAKNAMGSSAPSAQTAVVTPKPVPLPPVALTAAPTVGRVWLRWTAPYNGGSAITDYVVQFKVSTATTWTTFNDGVRATTGATVTGLRAGVAYVFRVSARNSAGLGGAAIAGPAKPT